jgi:hypothetical protein
MARARAFWATQIATGDLRALTTTHARRRVRWRRHQRLALLAAAVLLFLYLVAMLIALITARQALYAGLDAAHHAEADISSAALLRSPQATLTRARSAIAAADGDFARADTRLAPFGPVLRHLAWLPWIGDRVGAAPDIARLAHQSTSGSLLLLQGLQPILHAAASGHGHGSAPAILLARLARREPVFARACDDLSAALQTRRRLAGMNTSVLAPQLRTIDHQLPHLSAACNALLLLPRILGWRHPATYLIGYLNPDEIRATGGYLGSVGLLSIRDGRATQQFSGTWLQDNLAYPPPEAIGRFEGEPAWLFRDSNWSPDFPTSAALERFFAHLDLGWTVRNVINVTPQATADALRAVGGFYSPEYHRRIDARNVAQLTDYYTHHTRHFGPLQDLSGDTARKQFIKIVASHIFSRLNHASLSDMVRLAQDLGDAVTRRDIQINSTDPRLQALITALGADGHIDATTADYLSIVDSNLSYNKVNPYVHLRVGYHAVVLPTRWLQADLTLRYTNVPAPAYVYVNSFGPGAGRTGKPWDYADYVRVYVPAGAALQQQSGWQALAPGAAYGKTMFSGYIIVRKGHTRTIHLRYLVPPNVFDWSAGSAYRLTVQHQSGTHPDRMDLSLTTIAGPSFAATLRHVDSDWSRTVAIPPLSYRALPLAPAPPPDPRPGHWIEPNTYFGVARRF